MKRRETLKWLSSGIAASFAPIEKLFATNEPVERIVEGEMDKQAMRIADYEHYLLKSNKEKEILAEKWKDFMLLDPSQVGLRKEVATILENIQLIHKQHNNYNPVITNFYLDVARKIFSDDFIPFKLVHFNAMLSPCALVRDAGEIHDIIAGGLHRNKLHLNQILENVLCPDATLDTVQEITYLVAIELAFEFTREILHTLRANAGIQCKCEVGIFKKVFLEICSNLKKYPNWIVASPENAYTFFRNSTRINTSSSFNSCLGVKHWGDVRVKGHRGVINIFTDPLCSPHNMLIGHQGSKEEGLQYYPYIMITPPVTLKGANLEPRTQFFSKYAKRMFSGGEGYYANLNINVQQFQDFDMFHTLSES